MVRRPNYPGQVAPVPADPPPLGALLIRPAYAMRMRIQRAIEAAGFADFRLAHQNVFAWLPQEGIRLSGLAARAQVSKQTVTANRTRDNSSCV